MVEESVNDIPTNIQNADFHHTIQDDQNDGSASEHLNESDEMNSDVDEVEENFGVEADTTDEDEIGPTPPIPRRSSRVRQTPKWISSGEYLTKSSISNEMK